MTKEGRIRGMLIKFYLKVLKFIYQRWDWAFSRLDAWQLKVWLKMRFHIEDLTYKYRDKLLK
jgi:hypothetical protein